MTDKIEKTGLYVCLEGIKGSGKSSRFAQLCLELQGIGVRFSTATPTKSSDPNMWWEKVQSLQGKDLETDEDWKFWLYTLRSRYTALQTDWSQPLILGDRSIVTSYETRWFRWDDCRITISRVNHYNHLLPAPDVIIYLQVNLQTALERIRNRERDYGQVDESPERLAQSLRAYEAIRKNPPRRLKNTRWFIIDGEAPENIVHEQILETLYNCLGKIPF